MRLLYPIALLAAAQLLSIAAAEEISPEKSILERHAEGSERLADEQDELSADVQQLVIEQTVSEVIELLSTVEGIMDETTDYLADLDTGGKTIAAQTEIIEKIHQAAKAKQDQQGGGDAGSAMMDMMERMMGKEPGANERGKNANAGAQPGQGQNGDSDAENSAAAGDSNGHSVERRIPKAAGIAGKNLPGEFQQALDAYNRGLGEVSK
ncbi:hypothetical protein ACFSSA_15640 [Luteolibacter algae]|uniref:Uncharacterized protein n=1 Tax=Luteolibacter algae TaxID=454151 RepID=A0ABW5DAL3_9BACT